MELKKTLQERMTTAVLWILAAALAIGLLFAYFVYPEYLWISAVLALALIGDLAYLLYQNKQALRGRTVAFGLNSVITAVLVISIVGVINFLAYQHPQKFDMTKERLHTLSDQTEKVVKSLTKPVKAVVFAGVGQREQNRELLDEYRLLNATKFSVEYVDPYKEPTRTQNAGIRKQGTVQLIWDPDATPVRDIKIEDVNEEKLTNALIKLAKDKSSTLCALTGHGERSFSSAEADGYELAKRGLANQSYEIKDLNLISEGKIPETCSAIAIIGPNKAFFPQELTTIKDYLANGGRAVISIDFDPKTGDTAPDLVPLFQAWHIKVNPGMIVDPLSRLAQMDASVALLATFSKDSPITKGFQGNAFFQFSRSFEIIPGAPAGLNVVSLAQTTPGSWSETDLKSLGSGQVKKEPGKDIMGPLPAAVAVEGKLKDSKATRNTRLVVFGSSYFATNQFSRFGNNLDLFLNAASWIMEDESLISIRPKDSGPGRVDLTQKQGITIFLLTVVLVPLLVAAGGIGFWVYRRRL